MNERARRLESITDVDANLVEDHRLSPLVHDFSGQREVDNVHRVFEIVQRNSRITAVAWRVIGRTRATLRAGRQSDGESARQADGETVRERLNWRVRQ